MTGRDARPGVVTAVVVRALGWVVLRRVLGLGGVAGLGPGPDAEDVEIAVLRHRLTVLRRRLAGAGYTPGGRLVLAWLARLLPRQRWSAFGVTPSRLLRRHREPAARRWASPHTGRRAWRGLAAQVVDLVVGVARGNPRWGCVRMVGEAGRLGVGVSARSVGRILRAHGLGPAPRRHGGPRWVRFLRARAAGTVACDFCTVETVGLSRLSVVVVVEVERRTVQLAGTAAHPGGAWVTEQARTQLIGLDGHTDRRFRFLVRDRDTTCTTGFDAVFAAAGVQVVKVPPRSPRANAFAQRWVRTVRTGCLDWIPIGNAGHLRRVLAAFVDPDDRAGPHRGLDLDVPVRGPARAVSHAGGGRIEGLDVLGGIIHGYHRAA